MDAEDTAREVAAMSAVVQPEGATLGDNIVMRPLTGGSASICVLTNNQVYRALIEDKDTGSLPEFELLAFLYIHCADLAKVRRMALNPSLWSAAVLEWGESLPYAVLLGARAALEQSRQMLAAVKFEVESKPAPSGAKEESPPPNS
jgi:hypothetical protein